MLPVMGKNVIVSEETIRDLLEAHASLSAWYFELWTALREAGVSARSPDDAARAAFVERIAADFPELAAIARSIRVPRLYVPPPPPYSGRSGVSSAPLSVRPAMPSTPVPVVEEAEEFDQTGDRETIMEPASVRARESVRPGRR